MAYKECGICGKQIFVCKDWEGSEETIPVKQAEEQKPKQKRVYGHTKAYLKKHKIPTKGYHLNKGIRENDFKDAPPIDDALEE